MRKYTLGCIALLSASVLLSMESKAQHLSLDWAKHFGGAANTAFGTSSMTNVRDIKADSAGNTYVVGNYNHSADFNPGAGTAVLNARNDGFTNYVSDAYVAKYNPQGGFLWVRGIGGNGDDQGNRIELDQAGNVYIVGTLGDESGIAYFDTAANAPSVNKNAGGYSYTEGYVAKYDNNGTFIWAKTFGGKGYDVGNSLTVSKDGSAVYAGAMVSPMNATDTNGILMQKFDGANGNTVWKKHISGKNGILSPLGMVLDTDENLYVTGGLSYADTVDFDPGANVVNWVSAGGSSNPFLAKYDSAGNYVWVQGGLQMNANRSGQSQYMTIDDNNNVYITGYFNGDLTMDSAATIVVLNVNANDGFTAKYNSDGHCIWANTYGSVSNEGSDGIALDRAGNVIITGTFRLTVDFNNGAGVDTLVAAGSVDACWVKYDPAGNYLQAGRLGGTNDDWGRKLSVDGKGNIYVAGDFRSRPATMEPGTAADTLSNFGVEEAFIIKLFCGDTSLTQLTVVECGESYSFDGQLLTASGTYTRHYPSLMGCDSQVVLSLTLHPVPEAIITVDVDTLGTTQAYVTYQWMKNGVEISGATQAKYTVGENADYQVIVTTQSGCIDTSDIYTVTNHGVHVKQVNSLKQSVQVYPNPTNGKLSIKAPVAVRWELLSVDGRTLKQGNGKSQVINLENLAAGIYLLKILDSEGSFIKAERVVYNKD